MHKVKKTAAYLRLSENHAACTVNETRSDPDRLDVKKNVTKQIAETALLWSALRQRRKTERAWFVKSAPITF